MNNQYIWLELDNIESTEIMTYNEVMSTINWYNDNLSTNQSSIEEFYSGEEYIKILTR